MSNPGKFYLTTPIYYVNARPHIGHAYTTIVADAIARRKRALGYDTWFLTGTDEHGQKIERSAQKAGINPQQFADEVSAQFRSLWDRMGLTYDDYIRTTDEKHKRGVQKLWKTLDARGAIYLSSYTGQYSVGEEMFVDGPPGTIGPDGKPTETVTEENYFFRLSEYQLRLIDLIESDDPDHQLIIQPEVRRNEVLSFLRGDVNSALKEQDDIIEKAVAAGRIQLSAKGTTFVPGALKDLSISRSSFKWGIPVPGDEKHVIYVWLDALVNYMTAIGYGSDDPADQEKFNKYWPADLHLVGKEIIRFHCVYWPAFLMAAGLPLPKSIVAHGWLLFEESKMSKSRGNIVRTETILDVFGGLKPDISKHEQDLFGADVLRYFLLREIPFGKDGSFSFDALVQRYNSDLANGYGNLVSRTLAMIQQNFGGVIPESAASISGLTEDVQRHWALPSATSTAEEPEQLEWLITSYKAKVKEEYDRLLFNEVLFGIASSVGHVDLFLAHNKPWVLAKSKGADERKRLSVTLYAAAEAIRLISALLHPILPYATAKVWAQLGLGDIKKADLKNIQWGDLKPGTKLGELGPVFPRAEKDAITRMQEIEQQQNAPKPDETPAAVPAPAEVAGAATAAGQDASPPSLKHHTSKLESIVDSLAVAISESTSESSAAAAFTEAIRNDITGRSQEPPTAQPPAAPISEKITIDDFAKVELRVAQIKVAERVPKADKLLRLEVDLGYETRQILAGIAEAYEPESLIGRKVVIVANLAPRKLRGLESNGMIVAASLGEKGRPVLAGFLEDIEIGARLK
jgi:methionyl-tRNA synthetase